MFENYLAYIFSILLAIIIGLTIKKSGKAAFFKDDDGKLDIAVKTATLAILFFAVWSYFHTVHPVFEKEKKLKKLETENEQLNSKNTALKSKNKKVLADIKEGEEKLSQLGKDKRVIITENKLLKEKYTSLITANAELKKNLHETLSENDNAGNIAIQNKLENMVDEVWNQKLASINSYKQEEFDLIEAALKVASEEKKNIKNPYDKIAIDYFDNYFSKLKGEKISDDKEAEVVFSVLYNYRIDQIYKR